MKTRTQLNEDKQQEIEKEENYIKRKKTVIKTLKILTTLLIIFLSFFYYTTLISSKDIKVIEKRIIDKSIPISFNGVKIIHFSDLLYGSTMNINDLKKIVKEINLRKPDLVFFTGDLIKKDLKISTLEQENIINELKKLNSSIGKYAIYGDSDQENYQTILNQSNFTLLTNTHELIYNSNNEAILLVGLQSQTNNTINVEQAYSYYSNPENKILYTITLLHEPDAIQNINYHTNLFLAGHSLGGEINIPFIGSMHLKENAKIYTKNHYKENNYEIFINTGLGTIDSNIRLFNKPTINFYRISNQ